jgi:predicted AAA+ superfamily ATPase
VAKAINGVEPKYLFFDEIQKVGGWQEKVKRLYDSGRHKIFLSGSESLFIKGKARESLAGRIYEFQLKPLSLSEYAMFSGAGANPRLNAAELRALFTEYLATGGFPELVGVKDAAIVRKYARESILEKVLFYDVPRLFSIEEPSIMQSLLNIIIESPGLLVETSSLSRDLGVSRQTLSKYLYALEASLLVKKLYNFSKSRTSTERKLKKYYPAFACSALTPGADELHISRLVETACVLHADAQFFWRTPQKDEVDMVIDEGGTAMPVEIKWGRGAKASGMEKFMAKFHCARGLVLTREARGSAGAIKREPVIDFLLSRRGEAGR